MIQLALLIAAFILAGIEQFNARGRSLLGWAVLLVIISLLWGHL